MKQGNGLRGAVIEAAATLAREVEELRFSPPVAFVYNPLQYAWPAHRRYLERHGATRKKVIFLGMNPGPFGMAQTGVPFGDVALVRDWVGVEAEVGRPPAEHPKRPVEGFRCARGEVSGSRLWGLFRERFGTAEAFFTDHLVLNYCPLVFMEAGGRNRTPDKLPAPESRALYERADQHLRAVVEILSPDWLIGVGAFAESRAKEALAGFPVRIGRILHPSPANPTANRDWAGTATRQLQEPGIWS